MFLDYFALGLLIFVAIVLFYGIIAIRDIPYEIAKRRDHLHQDAIYAAGWISLFTLHVIWPLLWVWATLYREDRDWGFSEGKAGGANKVFEKRVANLTERMEAIEVEGAVVSEVRTRPNIASFSATRQTSPVGFSSREVNSKEQKEGHEKEEGVVAGSLRVRPNTSSKARPMSAADFLSKEDDAKEKEKEKEVEAVEEGVVPGSLRTRPNTASFSNTRPLTAADFLPEEDEPEDKGA